MRVSVDTELMIVEKVPHILDTAHFKAQVCVVVFIRGKDAKNTLSQILLGLQVFLKFREIAESHQ